MAHLDHSHHFTQNPGDGSRPRRAETSAAGCRRLFSAGILAVLLSCLPHSGARADYISIAVVGGQGLDFHGLGRSTTREAAESAAIAACQNPRCRLVMTYGPGQCAHIVTGTRQIFWNTNLFSARERKYVLAECQKVDSRCRVLRSECLPE